MNVHTHSEDRAEDLLRWYKRWLSPVFGNSCRFTPTCSEYAAQAVAEHGWIRGGTLALRRLLRCHPFASAGFDPLPNHKDPEKNLVIGKFGNRVNENQSIDKLRNYSITKLLNSPIARVVNDFSRHSS